MKIDAQLKPQKTPLLQKTPLVVLLVPAVISFIIITLVAMLFLTSK